MKDLLLKGGRIVTPLEERFTNLWLRGGLVSELSDRSIDGTDDIQLLDVSGCTVTPGLIDLQVNGNRRCNLWGNPKREELENLCLSLVKAGVTAFLPTLITDDISHMKQNIAFLTACGAGSSLKGMRAGQSSTAHVKMPGVHLEGPFLSPERPGVHPPESIKKLTSQLLQELMDENVRLITLAPEQDDPSYANIRLLQERGITVSLGHSNATFEQARSAFDGGVRLVTHTYNALPPLHHRAPGAVVAAMLDERVSCAVICDGKHVHPAAVKLLLKLKGVARVVLVTDVAQLGTSTGSLVGSSIYLNEAVKNVVGWGVATFAEAIRMSTWNAAQAVGLENTLGHIAPGKCADLVVWDSETLAIKHIITNGTLVF